MAGKNIYAGMGKKGLDDLKQFAARGVIELQNAVYTGSPYPLAHVVSAAQLSAELDKSMEVRPHEAAADRGLGR